MKTIKYRIISCLLAIGIIASSALAKMRPLTEMEDQFVRPNILVILDTSGSMMRDTTGNILSAPDQEGRTHGDHEDSRLNIAKGVITNVLDETRDLANFGLMSFKQTHFSVNTTQKGYFPYFKAGTDSSTTETIYFPKYRLDEAKYTIGIVPNKRANSGPPNFTPVNSFIYNGVTYTLKASDNSRYRRWSVDLKADRYADHNYSGYIAAFQDPDPNNSHTFTWKYQGSYYEYTKYALHTMIQLDHDVDCYDDTTGKVIAWVRVPVLKHDEDTVIYIYYGDDIWSPTENPAGVWDENYMGIWHLEEKVSGSGKYYEDSSSYENQGLGGGKTPAYVPLEVPGKIGYAADFDGDDFIEVEDHESLKLTNAITLSGWIKPKNFGSSDDVDVLIRKRKKIPPDYQLVIDDSYPQFVLNGGDNDPIIGSTNLSPNTWYYIAGTWKTSGSRTVYLNGSSNGTGSFTGPIGTHAGELFIGGMEKLDCIEGLLDEIRISNIARSADWIKTQYNNQNSPSTFYSLSSSSPDPGDFDRYMKITIDHTKVSGNSDLYDFPLLISIQDPELSTSGFVHSWRGDDIVFKQKGLDNLYHFDTYYGQEFIADGTEDEGGSASAPVDPNDIFVYYPGEDGIDFNYDSVAGWTDANYPVGALDKYDPNRGGILLVPFSFSEDQSVQDEKVNEIIQWMEPQNRGGLIAAGYTPSGSTLKNTVSDTNYYDDAYGYFVNEVITNDPISCRRNLILFVTDGEPSPIAEKTDAVNAATTLYNDKDVTVYMVGFGSDTTGSPTLDKIASAGGSPLKPDNHYAYFTTDQSSLEEAIKQIVFEAAAGDYVTSAPTTGKGSHSRMEGKIGLLSSCEFPYWKGHLIAADLLDGTQLWDAGVQLDANHIAHNARNIYTSNLSTGALVPFFDSNFRIPNAVTLFGLGLGASEKEASDIIEFISGKDRFWRLSDITNCTPIVVGTPYVPNVPSSAPGHDHFELTYEKRDKVIYSGSNDCMLHCFSMSDGDEVFAYVPPDLLPKLTQIFLNGEHIVTPSQHIYGMASSPKAYDIFHDGAWKTVLVCGEGPGGYNYFALDVTHPSPNDPGYIANAPFSVLWHTADTVHNASYDPIIGESWSTPAFGKITYNNGGSEVSKYVTFIGSGYDDPSSGDAEGTTFMAIKFDTGVENGKIIFSEDVGSASTIVDHGLVADAVCYENNGVVTDTYTVDTAGRIWHGDTNGDPSGWSMNIIYNANVNQPFFYSPAVFQMGSGASSKTLIVAGSGTSDDPNINQSGSTFSTKLYLLLFDSNHFLVHSEVIPLTDLVIEPISINFPQRSRITCSPVIIKNDISSQYEALFLAYVPPQDNNCDIGKTYLIVYKLGKYENFSLNQKEFIKSLEAGPGKITGIYVTAKSSIVVGVSGHGGGQTSTLTCIPSPPNPSFDPKVIQLYWKDYFSNVIEITYEEVPE